MTDTVVIDPAIYGIPGVGFGGYVSGMLADYVGPSAQVTLRAPPPLGRPLTVSQDGGGRVILIDGDALIAEAVPMDLDIQVPEAVGFDEAVAASRSFPGFRDHPFPMCFCCGPDRREGEGLRIFPGRGAGRAVVAAPWIPHPRHTGDSAEVRSEFVWAALDCPTYWGFAAASADIPPVTTGRIETSVLGLPRASERCVVLGWSLGASGRKFLGGAALFSEDGTLRAMSRATWLTIQPSR